MDSQLSCETVNKVSLFSEVSFENKFNVIVSHCVSIIDNVIQCYSRLLIKFNLASHIDLFMDLSNSSANLVCVILLIYFDDFAYTASLYPLLNQLYVVDILLSNKLLVFIPMQ